MLLTEHIKENQGRAFFIKSKEREVPLGPTIVDPNSIFSKGGATKALKKFKPTWEQRKLELLLAELDDSRNEFLFNLFFLRKTFFISECIPNTRTSCFYEDFESFEWDQEVPGLVKGQN